MKEPNQQTNKKKFNQRMNTFSTHNLYAALHRSFHLLWIIETEKTKNERQIVV